MRAVRYDRPNGSPTSPRLYFTRCTVLSMIWLISMNDRLAVRFL